MSKSTEEIAADILIAAIPKIPAATGTPSAWGEQVGAAFTILHQAVKQARQAGD